MSATSTWAKAYNVTVNLGGGAIPCTDGSFKITFGTAETTNTAGATSTNGALFTEHTNDTCDVELAFKFPWDTSSPPAAINYGKLLSSVSFTDASGVTHSGAARVNSVGKPFSAKGAFLTDIGVKFTGSVTNI